MSEQTDEDIYEEIDLNENPERESFGSRLYEHFTNDSHPRYDTGVDQHELYDEGVAFDSGSDLHIYSTNISWYSSLSNIDEPVDQLYGTSLR